MSGSNRETGSSVRGMTRRGLNCARGMGQSGQTQRSGVHGLWDTRGFWTMSLRVEDNECPNQG
jgi:hypothetical protein